MESSENYNFSIFRPRNLHGRKNRNVILTMLFIWAIAVFGFQFLLRAIEKPVPEKTLLVFEKLWPSALSGDLSSTDAKIFLKTLLHARGKGTLNAQQKETLSTAISCLTSTLTPDDIDSQLSEMVKEMALLRASLQTQKDQQFLETKMKITDISGKIIDLTSVSTGIEKGSLEASIFIASIKSEYPASMNDPAFGQLDAIMKLFMTHNQSVLTDKIFLGFPFHYFYTAVFLLILFIALCIVYNILIERRLKLESVTE